jgi:hypothetical protein
MREMIRKVGSHWIVFGVGVLVATIAVVTAVLTIHNDNPTVQDSRCTEAFRRVVAEANSMNVADLHQIKTPEYTCTYA